MRKKDSFLVLARLACQIRHSLGHILPTRVVSVRPFRSILHFCDVLSPKNLNLLKSSISSLFKRGTCITFLNAWCSSSEECCLFSSMLHAERNTAFLKKFCNCRKQRRLVFGSELADGHVALFYRNNNAFLKGIQPFVETAALSKRGGSLHETPGLKSWLGMFSVM